MNDLIGLVIRYPVYRLWPITSKLHLWPLNLGYGEVLKAAILFLQLVIRGKLPRGSPEHLGQNIPEMVRIFFVNLFLGFFGHQFIFTNYVNEFSSNRFGVWFVSENWKSNFHEIRLFFRETVLNSYSEMCTNLDFR